MKGSLICLLMKKLTAALLGCLLLFSLSAAGAAGNPGDMNFLSVTVEGMPYTLGSSSAEDLAANGFSYAQERDGTFVFRTSEGGRILARTRNGMPGDPMTVLDLSWADGVRIRYCGFSMDDSPDGGNEEFWSWLIDTVGARPNGDGCLEACISLRNDLAVDVVTTGIRVRLSLLSGR